MLQIGICDDMSDVRIKLHVLLERLLEAQSVQARSLDFPLVRGCSLGIKSTAASWIWCFWILRWAT